MEIEQEAFRRRRFIPSLMKSFGFVESGNGSGNVSGTVSGNVSGAMSGNASGGNDKSVMDLVYESDFMDGAFRYTLTVTPGGSVSGRVIDVMNDEEYAQLRFENFDGAYVNSVRAAYRAELVKIASTCCLDVLFTSDQANRITGLILERYGVTPDFPWDEDPHQASGVFRHTDSRKWFGLIMNIPVGSILKNKDKTPVDVMNLKLDTWGADRIMSVPGIFPAYHMNHRLWISVLLDDTLSDEEVMILVDDSFRLTGL